MNVYKVGRVDMYKCSFISNFIVWVPQVEISEPWKAMAAMNRNMIKYDKYEKMMVEDQPCGSAFHRDIHVEVGKNEANVHSIMTNNELHMLKMSCWNGTL